MENDNLLSLLYDTSQGDKHAFSTLYQQTSGKLFAISLNMLSNRAHAEEVLQDAFIKIWHNASEYNASKGTAISWMISIVRYRSLDALRYNKVRKEQTMGDDDFDIQSVDVNYDENTKLVNPSKSRPFI